MSERAQPFGFRVRSCGEHAQRVLRAAAPCRVAAVFQRSFYLQAEGALACLGNPAIGLGPLNGVIDVPAGMNWLASGLRAGASCRRGPDSIHLANRFRLSLEEARLWRPAPVCRPPDPPSVAHALDRLCGAGAGRAPADGLAPLLDFDHGSRGETAIPAAARESVMACRGWLAAVFEGSQGAPRHGNKWVRDLIGLGPGLTPSGDDFLGGIMIALHALGRPEAARRLAAATRAGAAGNAISVAHLAAAGDGQGHAAIHEALHGLLRGAAARIDSRLAAVGRIGHTSGWDTLAGVVTALEAWLAVRGIGRRAA